MVKFCKKWEYLKTNLFRNILQMLGRAYGVGRKVANPLRLFFDEGFVGGTESFIK